MDHSPYRLSQRFRARLIFFVYLCYIFCGKDANARAYKGARSLKRDPFYQVSLYHENYILPYHRLKGDIQARRVTADRTLGVFQEKFRKQRRRKQQENGMDTPVTNQTVDNVNANKPLHGHRRMPSNADPSRRHGGVYNLTIPKTVVTPLDESASPASSPMSPEEVKVTVLHRTLTVLGRTRTVLEEREKTERRLVGEREKTVDPGRRRQIEAELKEETDQVFRGLCEEMWELLGLKFTNELEIAFQVSIKIPLLKVARTNTRFYAAYTQQSWWQCYTGVSAFFRESNYMPEFFIEQPLPVRKNYGPQFETIKIGVLHQSNGAGLFLEASWNRLFMEWGFRWSRCYLTLEPWWVLPTKDMPLYNPKIIDDLGWWRVKLDFKDKYLQCSVHVQKNSIRILSSLPFSQSLNATFYYFNGKGLSLGLQNQHITSWGIGVGARP